MLRSERDRLSWPGAGRVAFMLPGEEAWRADWLRGATGVMRRLVGGEEMRRLIGCCVEDARSGAEWGSGAEWRGEASVGAECSRAAERGEAERQEV